MFAPHFGRDKPRPVGSVPTAIVVKAVRDEGFSRCDLPMRLGRDEGHRPANSAISPCQMTVDVVHIWPNISGHISKRAGSAEPRSIVDAQPKVVPFRGRRVQTPWTEPRRTCGRRNRADGQPDQSVNGLLVSLSAASSRIEREIGRRSRRPWSPTQSTGC
jgi:hypothetical protein